MKKTIGLRAEKDSIHWAVVSNFQDASIIEEFGKIQAPDHFTEPESLQYLRSKLAEILGRFDLKGAGVKTPETGGKPPRYAAALHSRCRIEGVILDLLSHENYPLVVGGLNTFSSKLSVKSAKEFLSKDSQDVKGVNFKKNDSNHKEAVVAAVAAMEFGHGS